MNQLIVDIIVLLWWAAAYQIIDVIIASITDKNKHMQRKIYFGMFVVATYLIYRIKIKQTWTSAAA